MRELVMHFDGSCVVNPGGPMRYGWHVDDAITGERIAASCGVVAGYPSELNTNNVAEFEALIRGLMWLSCLDSVDVLTIRGDSMLVVKGVNGEWQMKKPHLDELCKRAVQWMRKINAGHIDLEWVKREHNSTADALSNLQRA